MIRSASDGGAGRKQRNRMVSSTLTLTINGQSYPIAVLPMGHGPTVRMDMRSNIIYLTPDATIGQLQEAGRETIRMTQTNVRPRPCCPVCGRPYRYSLGASLQRHLCTKHKMTPDQAALTMEMAMQTCWAEYLALKGKTVESSVAGKWDGSQRYQ